MVTRRTLAARQRSHQERPAPVEQHHQRQSGGEQFGAAEAGVLAARKGGIEHEERRPQHPHADGGGDEEP